MRSADVCCVMPRATFLSVFTLCAACAGSGAGRPHTHRDPMVAAGPTTAGDYSPGIVMPTSAGGRAPGVGPRRSYDGMAGGPVSAMDLDGSCRGYIPTAPQIQFDVPMTATLVISASSGVDTTMMVVGPDGRVWCNDDTNGLDPQVSDTFSPGHYRVFIGTYSSGNDGPFHAEIVPG